MLSSTTFWRGNAKTRPGRLRLEPDEISRFFFKHRKIRVRAISKPPSTSTRQWPQRPPYHLLVSFGTAPVTCPATRCISTVRTLSLKLVPTQFERPTPPQSVCRRCVVPCTSRFFKVPVERGRHVYAHPLSSESLGIPQRLDTKI